MLYLRTGANGSCKTLFTLKDVRTLQLETNRPVCVNARFKIYPHKLIEFGWRVIDFKDWQDQPDGTIFMIDECHNDLPLRPNSAAVPEPVRMLAEHRARGFDFYLLTQHPMNMDAFVRKLIGSPGWHQHLKRRFGATNSTTVLQWPAVRNNCEVDGSGKNAEITVRKQPKDVYDWYESAELHTGKVQIPKQVYVAIACLVGMVVLGFGVYLRLKPADKPQKPVEAQTSTQATTSNVSSTASTQGAEKNGLTPAEYAQSFQPRIEGLAYTASRYDDQTKPTTAPYPAACINMGKRCECYTQQGTGLQVPLAMCQQIVKGGFFMDWQQPQQSEAVSKAKPMEGNPGQSMAVKAPEPAPPAQVAAQAAGDVQVLASMAANRRGQLAAN